ncbi:hypothetical protein OKW22_000454 [Bacilli bacterium PM5-3]|nr:hypothetical protein [Bacilli bacterium PM5-3]MDH6603762.1 hypothetical protein [Bacilli bacterium PM5-9]
MSRVERHKARREGKITGVGKSENIINDDSIEMTQKFDEINPIVRPEKKEEIKRKKSYENEIVSKSLNIEEIKEKASGQKTELFDIEEAFKRLKTKHSVPDQDTQLEIMSELFSDNGVEYNSTIEFEKDFETNRIMISEDELIKLLEEREKAYNKAIEKKRRKEKKQKAKEITEVTAPYIKEDLEVEEVIEVKKDDSIKNRISQSNKEFDDFEKSLSKKTWPLVVVLIVLIAILGFLIYNFIK